MLLLLALLAASSMTPDARAASPDVRRATFHGVADVAIDGRIRITRIEGVDGVFADAVRSQVEARRATPASRDGRAVAMATPFSGSVALTPKGEDVDVAIDQLALHPAPLKRVPIAYPVEAMRSERAGWIEVEFALDEQGAPVALDVIHASHLDFAKATMKPLQAWRFATAAVEPGRRFRIAFSYATDAKRPTPSFQCAVDLAHPHLDGQDGCADRISIHGSRIRR